MSRGFDRSRERGAALLVTLVVMALMALGLLSFSRSADTANLIAGNTAFRQAATQAAEIGIEQAADYIENLANPDHTVPYVYYAARLARDADDLPLVAWDSIASQQVGAYRVQQVLERMCDATPVIDPMTQCTGRTAPQQNSQKANTQGPPQLPPAIYYQVTVRVTGPRNSESLVQAAFLR